MKLLYSDITYQIRGACFWVWKEFGSAFKESIIDRALTEELRKRGLKVEDQKRIDIYYQGKKVGVYVPDKIVNDTILLEIKSKPFLTKHDIGQFWHYLKGTNYRVGFLINFGSKLEIKRIVYDQARNKDPRVDLRFRSACRSAGFTLIEMLVSIAAFSLIIVAISGIFSSVINAHRRIINVQNAQEPARYLSESMAKEIRMSTINSVPTTDPQGDASLSINNPAGENVTYVFANNALTKGADTVSPASVEINGKFFIVSGSTAAQAKVTVVMSIKSKGANPAYQTAINLQSTIATRGY